LARIPALPAGRGPSKPLRAFIPSKHLDTKRLRSAAWILAALCGYRATNANRDAGLRPLCKRIAPISDTSEKTAAREQGSEFLPRFDPAGLLTAIAQDAVSGEVLMVAFMDREALDATRRTGRAHFHSRSRGRLWMKGESSGHTLEVESILVDCDQDALVLRVRPAGPACHTGERSCFYRALEGDSLTRLGG
jgi:phosphoribosyl-AMP cyclohydrolase